MWHKGKSDVHAWYISTSKPAGNPQPRLSVYQTPWPLLTFPVSACVLFFANDQCLVATRVSEAEDISSNMRSMRSSICSRILCITNTQKTDLICVFRVSFGWFENTENNTSSAARGGAGSFKKVMYI